MSILTLVFAAWTAICWFSQPYGEPFLGLPLFGVDAALPASLTLISAIAGLVLWFSRTGRVRLATWSKLLRARRREVAILALILLLHTALSVVPIVNVWGDNDSDSALTGIAGYHIARGESRPMYCYGVHYVGSLVQHLSAPLHALFGPNPAYQRAWCTAFYLGFIVFTYLLGRMLAGPAGGLTAALIAAVPPAMVARQLRYTEFAEIAFWGSLALLLLARLLAQDKPRPHAALWLGVVLGYLFYVHPQALYFIGTAGVMIFLRDRLFFLRPAWWLVPLGLFIGSTVFWVDTWFSDGDTLRYFIGVETGIPAGLAERAAKNGAALLRHLPEFAGFSATHEPVPAIEGILAIALAVIASGALVLLLVRAFQKPVAGGVDAGSVQMARLLPVMFLVVCAIFLSSGKAWMNPAFRYLFPLWLLAPLLFAVPAALTQGRRIRWAGFAATVLLLIGTGWSQAQYLDAVRKQEADGRSWEMFLRERDITRFYGSFWLVYQTAFATREEIIGSSCYPTSYIPFRPYHWRTDEGLETPAFVYLKGVDRDAEGQAAWLVQALKALGIDCRQETQGTRIVVLALSERVTPKQILGIPVQSSAVIDVAGVARVEADGTDTGMRLLRLSVRNAGKGQWLTDGSKGFVELVISSADGTEIRRQPLMRDLPPDGTLEWRVLLDAQDGVAPLSAHITLNGINISRDKQPVSFDPAAITANDMSLDSLVFPGSAGAVIPDFALLRGWGRAADGKRWSGDRTAELGLVLRERDTRNRALTLVLAPVAELLEDGNQVIRIRINDLEAPDLNLTRAGAQRIPLPKGSMRPGFNRLTLSFSRTEPTWQDQRGYPIFRARPASIGLGGIGFGRDQPRR